MPPLPSLVIAWAAVYGYVCVYHVMLYARQRGEREYLAFALLAGALSVYALGAALHAGASTIEEAALAVRIKAVGVIPAVAFAVDFSLRLRRVRRSRVLSAVYIWAAVGLLATIGGWVVNDQAAPAPSWGWSWALDTVIPDLTAVGGFYLVSGWLFTAYAFASLVPHARADRDLRMILWGCAVNLLAGANDIAVTLFSLRSAYLLEHTAMLSMVTMSWVLLDRFVRTADSLDERRAELRTSYEELRRRQRVLVRKEQLAGVGELAAMIAHEVRNPLAIIKNASSGLRRTNLSAADRKTLTTILDEEAQRLRRLARDLLSYTEPMEPGDDEVDVESVLNRAVGTAARTVAGAELVQWQVHGSEVPKVRGDAGLLEKAFCHAIENAFQAMADGGQLDIEIAATEIGGEDALRVLIRDTGVGMDSKVRLKARDPFFSTRPSGSGLGLAIVDRIVKSHGGHFRIDSTPARGTTLDFALPYVPPPPSAATPVSLHQLEER